MRFSSRHGRLRLQLRLLRQGRDWLALFSGGAAHLGAVALAAPGTDGEARLLALPGHREDALVLEAARRLSDALQCAVCVGAGIHYDAITPEELLQVEIMVRDLTERCLAALTEETSC